MITDEFDLLDIEPQVPAHSSQDLGVATSILAEPEVWANHNLGDLESLHEDIDHERLGFEVFDLTEVEDPDLIHTYRFKQTNSLGDCGD